MKDLNILNPPSLLPQLIEKANKIGFDMASEYPVGALLKSLVSSKPNSQFLELGTGIGLSLAWMKEGMDKDSSLTSIDIDPDLIKLARDIFANDNRIDLICADGSIWIKKNQFNKYDLIFADAWPGKYSEIEEILDMLLPGGMYIIDDMKTQVNWPSSHQQNVDRLLQYLSMRKDLNITTLDWSTGIVIATKIS